MLTEVTSGQSCKRSTIFHCKSIVMLPIGNSAVISMLVFYKVNDTNAKFEMALIFYPNYDQRSEPEKNK